MVDDRKVERFKAELIALCGNYGLSLCGDNINTGSIEIQNISEHNIQILEDAEYINKTARGWGLPDLYPEDQE